MINDILASLLIPHLIVFLLLFRIAMLEVRPKRGNTVRRDLARLWEWVYPHWLSLLTNPFYWAGTAVATAFFLVTSLKGML